MKHCAGIKAAILSLVAVFSVAQAIEVPSDSLLPSNVGRMIEAQQGQMEQMRNEFSAQGTQSAAQTMQKLLNKLGNAKQLQQSGDVDGALRLVLQVREEVRLLNAEMGVDPFGPDSTTTDPEGPRPPVPPVYDSTGTVIWPDSSSTLPPDIIPGPDGELPPTLDSAGVAALLDLADATIDSFRAGMSKEQALALMDQAAALVDTARAMLESGGVFPADRIARQLFALVKSATKIELLEDTLAQDVVRVRAMIVALTAKMEDKPIPYATALLEKAGALADSADAWIGRSDYQHAAGTVARIHIMLDEARTLIQAKSAFALKLQVLVAQADSLAAMISGETAPTVTQYVNRARALIDSATARLEAGAVVAAHNAGENAQMFLVKARKKIQERKMIGDRIEGDEAMVDSLKKWMTGDPIPGADSLLAKAEALADTVRARLERGEVAGAEYALEYLHDIASHVKDMNAVRAWTRKSGEKVQARLTKLDSIADSTGNTKAQQLLTQATVSMDSMQARIDDGRISGAMVALHTARRQMSRAKFVLTVDKVTAKVIDTLRVRSQRVLAELPETAVREKAILQLAIHFADSAQEALTNGDMRKALRIAERTIKALKKLVPATDPEAPAVAGRLAVVVAPTPLTSEELEVAVENLMFTIGLAEELVAENPPDAYVDGLIADAVYSLEQIIVAIDEGTADGIDQLFVDNAQETAELAVAVLRGDAIDGTQDDDETLALIDAGEKAANPTGVGDAEGILPVDYAVSNAPNPFNPQTSIMLAMPEAGDVRLVIYNMLGQEVRTLVQTHLTAGVHTFTWNARDDHGLNVASGVYFARLVTTKKVVVNRMMLVR